MSESAKPVVSIITPTYNHEHFVGPCIESVLAQTYSNWEQVIIDDGSTDSTQSVVERYKDKRIHCIRQENQGIEALAHTYNRALAGSKGSLIAILEGDDTWPPDKLAAEVSFFEDPGVVLAFGECKDIDAKGRHARRKARAYHKRGSLPKSILFNDPIGSATPYLLTVKGQSLITTSTVLIRRSALDSIGGFQYFPGKCPTDIPTFARLSRIGKFFYAPAVLGYRRRHGGSATLQYIDVMPAAAEAFVLTACGDPSFGLGPTEKESIKESWRSLPFGSGFPKGRVYLVQGRWSDARLQFAHAMKAGELRALVGGITGWMLSWVHLDVEGLFWLFGRVTLK
ncbi:MAG TPA: glycosyltransferase [Candidatus Acidoferrales bacterium]|nr:glycosyltransferase [Candidatus Acidoferrales bacterium]